MESYLGTDTFANWLKLILISNFLNAQVLLSVVSYAWETLTHRFYTTVEFDEFDSTFSWINIWLAQRPEWRTARDISITTRSFGIDAGASGQYGEYCDRGNSPEDLKVRKQPSFFVTTSFWFKGHYLRATRSRSQGVAHVGLQTLRIQIYGHSPRIVDDLLAGAERCWKKAKSEQIAIYSSTAMNQWQQAAFRPKRPLDSIILDPGVKEDLLLDACKFLESRPWYSKRGIPFRRGYLLYGAPGSGKTSLIHSLAGELGLDVYMISLSRNGLDDTTLQELISRMPERCIALMEDIDAAFRQDINRESPHGNPSNAGFTGAGNGIQSRGVTLSGLLNAIDGVAAHEGRLLFATTNHHESLDPALCRPGRMDLHIEFKLASRYQIAEMFRRFYDLTVSTPLPPYPEKSTALHTDEKNGKKNMEDGSPNSDAATLYDGDVPDDSAETFANSVPHRFLSMAELQNYLMLYRSGPASAIEGIKKFIQEKKDREGLIDCLAVTSGG